jgi:hypothetical protein
MICPRCSAEFSAGGGVCPECGVQLLKKVSGMMKTSAVLISAGSGKGFYRSVREVPEAVRQELLRVTSSENSGTIVIADRAGKEQLTQIVARREAGRGRAKGLTAARVGGTVPQGRIGRVLPGLPWIVWVGAFLLFASAAIVVAVFTVRW